MEGALKISLKDRSIQAPDGFKYRLTKKFFNLYVLLALERVKPDQDAGGFVDVEYIAELSYWEKNSHLSVGKQITRHVIEMEKIGRNIIEYIQKVKGPFRLGLEPHQTVFDESTESVKSFLGLIPLSIFALKDSQETFYDYVQSMWEGDVAFKEGELTEALIRFQKAANEGANIENIVVGLHRMGRMLERLANYQEAHNIYKKAFQMIKSGRKFNYLLLAENYMYHGWIYYRQRKWRKAEEKYHKALNLIRGKIHYSLLGDIYNGFGKIFEGRENYKEALSFYQKALACWVPIAYFYGIQACYFNIGNLYKIWADKDLKLQKGKVSHYAQEKYERATMWAKECIRLCDRTGVGDETSQDRILVSYCYFRLRKYDDSLSYALEAKEMADASGNIRDLAASCKRLGKLYWIKGDTVQANQLLKKSIGYYLRMNDVDEVQDLRKEFGL